MSKIDNIFKEATKEIIASMEKDGRKWKKNWVSVLPKNGKTKREYRGFNMLYLSFLMKERNHSSEYFLTFNQVKELKGRVKKGAKSYPIFYYAAYYKVSVTTKNGIGTTLDISATSEKEALKKAEERKDVQTAEEIVGKNPFLTMSRIFNLDDIEGLDSLKTANNEAYRREDIDSFIAKLDVEFRLGEPSYSPALDVVSMPPIEKFSDENGYYSVLFHELTHWTGAKHRLNREGFYSTSKEDYAFEELIAELGSLYLSIRKGVKTEDAQHPEYIKSWIRALENNPKYIWKAASKAQEAVDYLLSLEELKEVA